MFLNSFPKVEVAYKAYEFCCQALDCYEEISDDIGIARASLNMGGLESLLGKYKKSLKSLKRGAEIYNKVGDKRNVCAAYINLGDSYTSQGYIKEGLN